MKTSISAYYLFFYAGLGATYPFFSYFFSEQGMSTAEVGTLLAVNALVGILAQPIMGVFNDKAKDYRIVLRYSGIVSAVILCALYFVHGFWIDLVIISMFAIVQASAGPILDAIAVTMGTMYGFSFGEARLWGALGFAVSTTASGYLYGTAGYGHIFLVYLAMSAICFGITWAFPKVARAVRHTSELKNGLRTLVTNWRFVTFTWVGFLVAFSSAVNFSFFAIYFHALHYPMKLLGVNFTVAAVCEIPLFFFARRILKRFGHLPVLTLAGVFYATKFAVMALAPPLWLLFLIQSLDGLGFALYNSASVETVNQLAPESTKAASQTVFSAVAGGLSNIVGASVGGLILQHGSPQGLFLVIALVSIGAACAYAALIIPFRSLRHTVPATVDGVQDGV